MQNIWFIRSKDLNQSSFDELDHNGHNIRDKAGSHRQRSALLSVQSLINLFLQIAL